MKFPPVTKPKDKDFIEVELIEEVTQAVDMTYPELVPIPARATQKAWLDDLRTRYCDYDIGIVKEIEKLRGKSKVDAMLKFYSIVAPRMKAIEISTDGETGPINILNIDAEELERRLVMARTVKNKVGK